MSLPVEDRRIQTKSYLLDRVTTALGGRVSESLVLGDISTGAQNDLERATDLVRKMITEYGMSEELGPITYGRPEEQVFMGRDLARPAITARLRPIPSTRKRTRSSTVATSKRKSCSRRTSTKCTGSPTPCWRRRLSSALNLRP